MFNLGIILHYMIFNQTQDNGCCSLTTNYKRGFVILFVKFELLYEYEQHNNLHTLLNRLVGSFIFMLEWGPSKNINYSDENEK